MKKTIALILALAMLLGLSSCGGNIGNTAYRPMNDIVLSKTNKTDSIDSDKPFPGDKFINPLSGELSDRDLSMVRPVGFMNNNIYAGTPQHGISNAEIVFEMNAEGNITRFLTVYQDLPNDDTRVGSIRSARPYYLDWVIALDAILVRAGGSETANRNIINRGVTNINALVAGLPTFYREQSRLDAGYAWEHTLFTTGSLIHGYFESVPSMRTAHNDGYSCSLNFGIECQSSYGEDAPEINVGMNPVKHTKFRYDPELKKYMVHEYDQDMIDGNTNQNLYVKNVLMLFTKYWHEYPGSVTLLADMSGGNGKYACEGKIIDITWSRTDDGGLQLYKAADGSPLTLMVGHSFVCCPNASSGSVTLGW